MNNNELKNIADSFGTPLYVFDLESLRERTAAIRGVFSSDIKLCYSIKANSFLLEEMSGLVDKVEVCSPGELNICKRLSIDSDKIIYSGVNKSQEDISDALDYSAGVFTAESPFHVSEINRLSCERGRKTPLLLRLTSGNQFGMSAEDVRRTIEHRADFPGIDIVGIHYFAGTQRRKLSDKQKELEMLREFFDDIEKTYSFRLKRLEYGPGLSVPYFEGEDFSDTLAPAREIADLLAAVTEWAELTVEMGRFFAFECGSYISAVSDVKSSGTTNYCIIDGGMNHLNYYGQMMGMKHPVITHLPTEETEEETKNWCICGSLCTTADVVVREMPFTGLRQGDRLVFGNAGAYSVTEGIYLFLSRMMPKIVLREAEGQYRVVRDFFDSSIINTAI